MTLPLALVTGPLSPGPIRLAAYVDARGGAVEEPQRITARALGCKPATVGEWAKALIEAGWILRARKASGLTRLEASWCPDTLSTSKPLMASGHHEDPGRNPMGDRSPPGENTMRTPVETPWGGGGWGGVGDRSDLSPDPEPLETCADFSLTSPPVVPARKTRKKAKPRAWPPSADEEVVVRRVLSALSDAREAQGWPPMRLRASTELRRDSHGSMVNRLRELRQDGEQDPEGLLVAVVRAKVVEHAGRDGRHGEGAHAVPTTICAGRWWDSNLAAGRAWLERGGEAPRDYGPMGGLGAPVLAPVDAPAVAFAPEQAEDLLDF